MKAAPAARDRTRPRRSASRAIRRLASWWLAALLLLAACTQSPVAPPLLTLSPASVELLPGSEVSLQAHLAPEDPNVAYAWSATAGSLASAGAAASYTAPNEPGSYSVAVHLLGDPSVSAAAAVTVIPLPTVPTLTLSPDAAQVHIGSTTTFTATLEPSDPDATFTWSSAAGVLSGSGAAIEYVAPAEPGEDLLEVRLNSDPSVMATAAITVNVPLNPAQVLLSPKGGSSSILTGRSLELVLQTDGTPGEIEWHAAGGTIVPTDTGAVYTAGFDAGQFVVSAEYADFPSTRSELTITVSLGALDEAFSIVVIPDTQTIVRYVDTAPLMVGIGEWIVAAVEDRNIVFVTQVGDVVWHPDRSSQWNRALAGLDLLHGEVPYSVSLGDHEYLAEEFKDGDTSAFRSRFGPERFDGFDWYRGAHPDGLSHYQIFEAGGREFLHLNLEWEPVGPASVAGTPMAWARSVLEANPGLPTLITTHAYLWDMEGEEGHFPDSAREGKWEFGAPAGLSTTSGVGIYEALVKPFPQVFMVFNGHYHKAEDEPSRRGEYHQVSYNDEGSEVYEMLANYQWVGDHREGDDWLRIVTFTPGGAGDLDRIDVETFSPERFANGQNAFKTGAWSQFGFDLDFAERFDLP